MLRKSVYFIFSLWLLMLFATYADAQKKNPRLNYNVFCFYYNWYGNPDHDGKYIHWAHPVLKSGPSDTTTRYIPGSNNNIAANFYPALGTYSSNDRDVISAHMKMIARAGIGNIVLTWWAKDSFTTQSVSLIMDEAAKRNIKVSFHIEPFSGRNAATTRQTIQYIMDTYGNHPAFYRSERHGNKPFFFIYDSYLTTAKDWSTLLMPGGQFTIRNTKLDAVMIGLWVSKDEKNFFNTSGFDGFYTYFASSGFTYGSTPKNWLDIQKWANKSNKIFIPCVGPGYIDTRVRPWNNVNVRDREGGKYYDAMFATAIQSGAPYIGITSFNEWHEGTQIEPAIPFKSSSYLYLDYASKKPDFYLKRTQYWMRMFKGAAK